MDEKRDEKGRFIRGYGGGPGRGRKKEEEVELDGELLDAIEQVVRTGLGAKELKDRLKAAGIALRVQSMRKPDDGPIVEPFVDRLLRLLDDIPGSGIDAINVIEMHMRSCPNSPIASGKFEEIEDE